MVLDTVHAGKEWYRNLRASKPRKIRKACTPTVPSEWPFDYSLAAPLARDNEATFRICEQAFKQTAMEKLGMPELMFQLEPHRIDDGETEWMVSCHAKIW